MYCCIYSGGLCGVEGYLVHVEADVCDGLPSFTMVGMPACEVKEAGERVRAAMKNSGFRIQPKRITVNLSPADIRKEGSLYDLPIAIAILSNFGFIPETRLEKTLILGELSLDGAVNPVSGVLPIACAAKEAGIEILIVPEKNQKEAALIDGIFVYGTRSLRDCVSLLCDRNSFQPYKRDIETDFQEKKEAYAVDFSEVNGQQALRRAAEVAAAGMHNLLIIGPPGSGKTMIAQRMPTILPSLSMEESIEVMKIYSAAGCLKQEPLIAIRPFRSPHHSVSIPSLIGGGKIPHPGEISLSSYGILFLDELPEFDKNVLEALRQPLEEKKVIVSRVQGSYEFPANFMLVAAMNACMCGYYPDRNLCRCKESDIKRYLSRISRPLLDRIDIFVEASRLSYEDIHHRQKNETSQAIRKRVERARELQKERYREEKQQFNSQMSHTQINKYCDLNKKEQNLMKYAFERLHLTARSYDRVLKVARTIADLDTEEKISEIHLSEAIAYRNIDNSYWG